MGNRHLIRLDSVTAKVGNETVYSGVSLNIHQGDRIALVGRNGSGKSTLAAMIAGDRECDGGMRTVSRGVSIGYLSQVPDISRFKTLGDFVASTAVEGSVHQAEKAIAGLGFDPGADARSASGGEARRAAIAALLAGEPDLMILDEPTNHLDIEAVVWLEERLRSTASAVLLISHDRAMLSALSERTIWIDCGRLRKLDRGFAHFEDWHDQVLEQESAAKQKLDKAIRAEARWAARGISARRKRNQRRLAELEKLRRARRDSAGRADFGNIKITEGDSQSRILIEAENISKSFSGLCIANGLSLRIRRGDRVALTGPNGCGKTTVLRLICGGLKPDHGRVWIRDGARIATFEQMRDFSSEDKTVREYVCGSGLNARDRINWIMVGDAPRHIAGYLKDFLFSADQLDTPLRALSGGERARLELARLMARGSDILVLDEPTNDLDMETLDLLQELLGDYRGAVLLVSHDRDFLDRAVTGLVAFRGQGRWTEYVGGWSDNLLRLSAPSERGSPAAKTKRAARPSPRKPGRPERLSFTEAHRLGEIESELPVKEAEVTRVSESIARLSAGAGNRESFQAACRELAKLEAELSDLEHEWFHLSEKKERSGSA